MLFQIGPFQSTKSERAKLKVKVRLNLHGIVSLDSATVSQKSSVVLMVDGGLWL